MLKGSTMAVSSPRLIEMALGEKVDFEKLGGWRMHAETTGLIDMVWNQGNSVVIIQDNRITISAGALDASQSTVTYNPTSLAADGVAQVR